MKDPKNKKYRNTGAGSRSLEERDGEVIKAVRQATLQEYVEELRYSNGTQVSESLVSNAFRKRYDIPATFRVGDLVSIDRFSKHNNRRLESLSLGIYGDQARLRCQVTSLFCSCVLFENNECKLTITEVWTIHRQRNNAYNAQSFWDMV